MMATVEGTIKDCFAVNGSIEVCSVRAGETAFCVPIMQIVEILGTLSPEPVPLAPFFIGGLVHYRGEILTAVSLRNLLEMPASKDVSDMLVFEGPGEYFGVLVDSIGDVITVRPGDFDENPSTMAARGYSREHAS